MNVLIIQSAGKHEKNKLFRECLCLQRSLKRIGVNAEVCHNKKDYAKLINEHDKIIILENYHADWIPQIPAHKTTLFWSIDAHIALQRQIKFCKMHRVNMVLSSTAGYCKHFKKAGLNCRWFPNAYPADLIHKQDAKKIYGVGFCGNVANRGEWIKQLCKRQGMRFDKMVIGQDMVKAIAGYKIHWNKNYSNDVNYRTFETLGIGTFLLTNKTDNLNKLFDIGKHLVTYSDYKDCVNKINYYLKHEKEREKITEAGYNHVRNNHTYDNRANTLRDILWLSH